MEAEAVLSELRALANPDNAAGMARFGISAHNTLGISVKELRRIAKGRRDHALAEALWQSGIHEARVLASMVDDPHQVTEAQMERWAVDFDSWDVVDQVCGNLFDRTPFAVQKVFEWSQRPEEYVRRAAFTLIASLAVHNKSAPDDLFRSFLPVIEQAAVDERNFVKKAVNWALRGIGKRSPALRAEAIQAARGIRLLNSRSARWIAADALRELESYQDRHHA